MAPSTLVLNNLVSPGRQDTNFRFCTYRDTYSEFRPYKLTVPLRIATGFIHFCVIILIIKSIKESSRVSASMQYIVVFIIQIAINN